MWSSWVDDCLCIGPTEQVVSAAMKGLTGTLMCNDTGETQAYIGDKVKHV
jgi:hypothetical protein